MNGNDKFGLFNDLRIEAKFIDKGVQNLMEKLEQPILLGLELEGKDLKADALRVMDYLENNVDLLENTIKSFLINHDKLVSDYKENLENVEQYIEHISADLNDIEKILISHVENYIPYNFTTSGINSLQTVHAGNNSLQNMQSDYEDLGRSKNTNVLESNIGDGLKNCTPIPNDNRSLKIPITVQLKTKSDQTNLSDKENDSIKKLCDRFMIKKPFRPILENSMTSDNTISNNHYVPVPAKNRFLGNSSPLLLTAVTLEKSRKEFCTAKKLPEVPVSPSLSAFSLELLSKNGSFK